MKVLHQSAFGGLLALGICAASTSADARTLSGYGAFKPWPNHASQQCISESFGAAINTCGSTQGTMIFELPNETSGSVTAVSLGAGASFGCYATSYNPANSSTFQAGGTQTFPSGQASRNMTVTFIAPWSLRLVCGGVPNNRGIGGLQW
jgi:hypothetical protein